MSAGVQHTVSGWVQTFEGLGFGLELPAPESTQPDWDAFASSSWRLPAGLVAIGGLTAAAVPLVLFYYPPQAKGEVPPWAPFLGAACLTLLTLGAVALPAMQWRGLSPAAECLDGAVQALHDAGAMASSLRDVGTAVAQGFDALYSECPRSVQDSLGNSIGKLKTHVEGYTSQVEHLSQALVSAAAWVANSAEWGADVAGSLPDYVPLPFILAISCCVAIAVPLVAATDWLGEKYSRRLGRCRLPYVAAAVISPSMILISLVSAAELSLGVRMGAFCSSADTAVVNHVNHLVGNNNGSALMQADTSTWNASSSGLGMIRSYVTGQDNNPALVLLRGAETEIDVSIVWVKRYAAPLNKICPPHLMASIVADLRKLKSALHQEKALLMPDKFYDPYSMAIHEIACGSSISGLGWLFFLQVVLCIVCLPALVLTAAYFFDGVFHGRDFRPVSREEEQEDTGHEEEFDLLYQAIFIFSAVLFVAGALMYFIPSTRIIRRVSGTLLFVCATFLITNSDLVVTYVRMKIQIGQFEDNNARFAKTLDEQAAHVRTLQKAAQGLKEIDEKFGGDIQQAVKEVDKLKVTARTNVAMCARQLCRMYDDREKDGIISTGPELDASFELMGTVFGGIVEEYTDREMRLRASLTFHPKYQEQHGLKVDVFAKLMEAVLKEESPDGIPDAVNGIMDAIH